MKKIGIVGWNTGENSFGVTKPYIEWLSNFGIVQILSPQKGIDKSIDLLILPGGLDIAPQSMNQVPGFYTSNSDIMKQYFYDNNLDQYIESGIPIFGICLGFQQLCVKFGGELIQNYGFNYSNKNRMELVDTLEFTDIAFNVFPTDLLKKNKYQVNSLHHQGYFDINNNGSQIEVIANDKDFGNVEIAKFSENIYGVQYHPEEIYDPISSKIIRKLLKYDN